MIHFLFSVILEICQEIKYINKMKVASSKVKLFSHGKFLAEHLKDGCKDVKTDLQIQCIDGNVHLHKVILGAKMVSSSLLRALKSSSVEDETLTIIIPEVKREFVQHLRNLLYTGKVIIHKSRAGVSQIYSLINFKNDNNNYLILSNFLVPTLQFLK